MGTTCPLRDGRLAGSLGAADVPAVATQNLPACWQSWWYPWSLSGPLSR